MWATGCPRCSGRPPKLRPVCAARTKATVGGDPLRQPELLRDRRVAAAEHATVRAAVVPRQLTRAVVAADHGGDVGHGLPALFGQPAEVASGERALDEGDRRGELAVEVQE